MKSILTRLRRLENAGFGLSRSDLAMQANCRRIVEDIRAARRKRLGPDYRPLTPIPVEVFAGCRTIADHIRAARWYRQRTKESDVRKPAAQERWREGSLNENARES